MVENKMLIKLVQNIISDSWGKKIFGPRVH